LESVSSGIQQAWSLQKSQQRVQKKEQEQKSLMKPFYKGSVQFSVRHLSQSDWDGDIIPHRYNNIPVRYEHCQCNALAKCNILPVITETGRRNQKMHPRRLHTCMPSKRKNILQETSMKKHCTKTDGTMIFKKPKLTPILFLHVRQH
jgi:hypothetical protein